MWIGLRPDLVEDDLQSVFDWNVPDDIRTLLVQAFLNYHTSSSRATGLVRVAQYFDSASHIAATPGVSDKPASFRIITSDTYIRVMNLQLFQDTV